MIIFIPNNSFYDLSISTTNENIKINQMSFLEELSIVTNNGDIELSNVNNYIRFKKWQYKRFY